MNATTSRQTADLVNRSRRGDTEAFSDLVQAYQKAACATALSFRRVFTPTNTYDNLVHGPSGQVEVVIALPPGIRLTVFHLNSHRSGSRYHIEADSGEVRLFVREKLAGRIHLTLHSLCGRLLARGLKSAQQPGISNCTTDPLVSFTTRADQSQETEFYANTRDGDIIVEKTS